MEALGAEKKLYGPALGGSLKKFKTVFSHLGGQKAPQREAKSSKIDSKRGLEFKMAKP